MYAGGGSFAARCRGLLISTPQLCRRRKRCDAAIDCKARNSSSGWRKPYEVADVDQLTDASVRRHCGTWTWCTELAPKLLQPVQKALPPLFDRIISHVYPPEPSV
jgi:hypothetical protein